MYPNSKPCLPKHPIPNNSVQKTDFTVKKNLSLFSSCFHLFSWSSVFENCRFTETQYGNSMVHVDCRMYGWVSSIEEYPTDLSWWWRCMNHWISLEHMTTLVQASPKVGSSCYSGCHWWLQDRVPSGTTQTDCPRETESVMGSQ